MDWNRVIENLRSQTKFYADEANRLAQMSGYYESSKEYRASANVASILASALTAGLPDSDWQAKKLDELRRDPSNIDRQS